MSRRKWQATGQEACRDTYRAFYQPWLNMGRIRETTKGTPSPQLYAYKKEKLQELEQ